MLRVSAAGLPGREAERSAQIGYVRASTMDSNHTNWHLGMVAPGQVQLTVVKHSRLT
jgi:hypothetical protein